ncbi:zinc finger, CCHC-type containing protein [Tanacetum coccineum]
MGDANPIRTLGDYSKPSHEDYRNTIELPVGNNVVPLRSDTIRTTKLRNDILMFQKHHGESLSEAWTCFKDLLQKVPHHGIDRWLQIQIFYDHVSFHLKCEIDHAAGGKIRNKNPVESWEIIENLALYDHKGWNDAKEFNEPPKQSPFTFRECTGPIPQPQALGTTFEARVRDYMAAHTERMERFENAIFKQRKEINDKMAEMFGLLKELTTSRAPEKVLIREDAKSSVTKNVNSISLAKGEEERNNDNDVATGEDIEKSTRTETVMPVNEAENGIKNEPIRKAKKEETTGAPSSRPVEYYLKYKINEKLIEGLVDNHRFNDSLSGARVGKIKGRTYNLLLRGPVYEAVLKKKITKKEDIGGNVNSPWTVEAGKAYKPYHSYIYPLGIVEDILVEVAEHVYPIDFIILDIKENEKRPFILGTPFLTTAKAVIKFDKGTITLRSGKNKISFNRIPESLCNDEKGIKNDIKPIAPTMTVNRLVLEWEEKIKLHQEKKMEFDRWRNKNFKNERPAPVKIEDEVDDEGEVTCVRMVFVAFSGALVSVDSKDISDRVFQLKAKDLLNTDVLNSPGLLVLSHPSGTGPLGRNTCYAMKKA